MRKSIKLCVCGLAAAMIVTGCSGKTKDDNPASTAATGSEARENKEITGTVKLGDYKGIPVEVTKAEVSEDEINASIEQTLSINPEVIDITDRAVQEGDIANIDYEGKKDGTTFDSNQGYDLEIGSGNFIPGFEEALIGAKIGDTKELDLTFPEDYGNKDLAGAAATFTVKVNSIHVEKEAEFTDEFVQRVSQFKTTEEFKENVKSNLLKQKEEQIEAQKEYDVLQIIIENAEIEYDDAIVESEYQAQIDIYQNMVEQYGMTLEDYVGIFGMDLETFQNDVREQCIALIKETLVVDEIAKQEKMEVTDGDRKALEEIYGMSVSMLVGQYGQEEVDRAALNTKVRRLIADNAVVTEVEPTEAETEEAAVTESNTNSTEESEAESGTEETSAAS